MTKTGRPRLPADERLAYGIGCTVTLSEYKEVLRLSDAAGLSMSGFVREALYEKLERGTNE